MRPLADHVMRGFKRQAVLPQIAGAIPNLEIFDTLNEEQATRVASVCVLETFSPGELLFAESQPADRMFVITRGSVRITSAERAVGSVSAGESLGEVSLLTGEPHSASASAEDEVVAGSLSRAAVEELARQRPDIGVVLYRNLAIGLGRKLQRADGSIRATRAFTRPLPEETP
jgi:CRP-like cAMP-binding protein